MILSLIKIIHVLANKSFECAQSSPSCHPDWSTIIIPYKKHLQIKSADVSPALRVIFELWTDQSPSITRLIEWAVTFQRLSTQKHKFCLDNDKDRSHMVGKKSDLRWQCKSDNTMEPITYWNTTAKQLYTTLFFFLHFPAFSTLFKIVLIL